MINDKAAFKILLLESCHTLLVSKINELSSDMKAIQDSANEETKSSAGDKYETGRAMAMLEKEKLASQYNTIEKQIQLLSQLKPSIKTVAESGSVVVTKQAVYYLSVSIGQISVDSTTVFCISPVAPIAQAMMGKTIQQNFSWNGKSFEITDVF